MACIRLRVPDDNLNLVIELSRTFLLPPVELETGMPVSRALAYRRSIRKYSNEPLKLGEVAQLLWATYGISDPLRGFKTAPSAGATFPLEVYLVAYPESILVSDSKFLPPGSYKYDPYTHSILLVKEGDLRERLYRASLAQDYVKKAKACIALAAVFERTTSFYGERGIRYVWIEVGHASQNLYLQATSMGLATVAIGAFYDEEVEEILGLDRNEKITYLLPVARPIRPYTVSQEALNRYFAANRARRGL